MMTPFEWVVGDSSKNHTVTALPPTAAQPPRYTTLRGTTRALRSRAGGAPFYDQTRLDTAVVPARAHTSCPSRRLLPRARGTDT